VPVVVPALAHELQERPLAREDVHRVVVEVVEPEEPVAVVEEARHDPLFEHLAGELVAVVLAGPGGLLAVDEIELVEDGDGETVHKDRAERRTWLEARDYRVVRMGVADVERDLAGELERLEASLLAQR